MTIYKCGAPVLTRDIVQMWLQTTLRGICHEYTIAHKVTNTVKAIQIQTTRVSKMPWFWKSGRELRHEIIENLQQEPRLLTWINLNSSSYTSCTM